MFLLFLFKSDMFLFTSKPVAVTILLLMMETNREAHNWTVCRECRTLEFFFLLDIFFIYISNVIPFPGFPSENALSPPLSPCSPTIPLWLPSLGIPLHRVKASPPIDEQQSHHLLHMQLEPWVPLYSSWWCSFWELWGYWLVHIAVPSMGLQTMSAPWVVFLAPPLGHCV